VPDVGYLFEKRFIKSVGLLDLVEILKYSTVTGTQVNSTIFKRCSDPASKSSKSPTHPLPVSTPF